MSGRFSIEVKYWKTKFINIRNQKQKNKKKKENKKIIKPQIDLGFTAFSYYNFSSKNIYEGVPFCKICRDAACN